MLVLFTMVVDLIKVNVFDSLSAPVSVKTANKALCSGNPVCIHAVKSQL